MWEGLGTAHIKIRFSYIISHTEFTAAAVHTNFELFVQPLAVTCSFGGDKEGRSRSDEATMCYTCTVMDEPRQPLHVGWDLFVSGGGAKNKTLMRYNNNMNV